MSTDELHDRKRVNAVQGSSVELTLTGQTGTVANSYVLGDTLTLYVKTPAGGYLWADESDVMFK